MDTTTINSLSKDSLYTLFFLYNENKKSYEKSISRLDELLKYSPEYSSYDEVKNIKIPYRSRNPIYGENINKIFERFLDIDYFSATFIYNKYK